MVRNAAVIAELQLRTACTKLSQANVHACSICSHTQKEEFVEGKLELALQK